jgi:hypothetical protein
MKYKNYSILLLFTLTLGCGALLDPFKEEVNTTKNDKISLNESVKIVKESMVALSSRCPQFLSSRYNWISGYFVLVLNDPCNANYDAFKGCADENYLSRKKVLLCSLVMQNDPCLPNTQDKSKPESRFSSSFAVTYAVCASAFKRSPINLVF